MSRYWGICLRALIFRKAKTELLVMVTPRLVKPLDPGQPHPLPKFPVPFLDDEKFDGNIGKASDANSPRARVARIGRK